MEMINSFIEILMANIAEIRINYIIDIGIIAIVFYKLLGLIKETRAEQLVKGFIIILIISKLSGWAKLYAINYILQSTFTIGLIALVILFQPELRKALEHLGRSQWILSGNKKTTTEELNQSINEIVDAVGVMSRKKIGALIVVERLIGINDIIETGTVVDAKISADLLMNIFYPKSPLHDGAVVIKNNRLMAAGCLLPLSSNKYISKELGTRHRAAMGMTESSDSMIIIVSEETGAISMAIEGKLQRFLDTSTLKSLIKSNLEQEKDRDNKEKNNKDNSNGKFDSKKDKMSEESKSGTFVNKFFKGRKKEDEFEVDMSTASWNPYLIDEERFGQEVLESGKDEIIDNATSTENVVEQFDDLNNEIQNGGKRDV